MHIKNILQDNFENPYESLGYCNFRCNVCGDSVSNKFKRRGFILMENNPWMYYCHNCQYKVPVTIWMRDYFPLEYRAYITDKISYDRVPVISPPIIKPPVIDYNEQNDTKHFKNILKGVGKIYDDAREICYNRKIPLNVWENWFIANNGRYKERIIIPFYDNNNKIYNYSGRAIYNATPKYLLRKGEHNSVYNFFNVNKEKPVIVVEGMIDSLFIDNCVAITGLKTNDKNLLNIPL
jgi:hypothetical protein